MDTNGNRYLSVTCILEKSGIHSLKLKRGNYMNNKKYPNDVADIDGNVNIGKVNFENSLKNELQAAINQYGKDRIDLYVDCDEVYGMYHSYNNSFAATTSYKLPTFSEINFKNISDELGIGYCEV